jgi:hypothetical protein
VNKSILLTNLHPVLCNLQKATMAAQSTVSVPISSLPKSAPSICIPRVFPNITWQRVKGIFEDLGLGTVDRVDMVNKTNDKGQKFKRVFVHFKQWNSDETAQQVREKLLGGDQVKIVYDEPWFWKIAMSTAPRPDFEKKTTGTRTASGGKRERKAPRVMDVTTKTTQSVDAVKSAKSEIEELRRQIAEQKKEMEALKAAASGSHTPDYSPSTPDYAHAESDGVPPLLDQAI